MELNKADVQHTLCHFPPPLGWIGVAPTLLGPQGTLHHNGTEHVMLTSGIHWLRPEQRTTLPTGAYPQLPGYTHTAGCSQRTSPSTFAATNRGGQPLDSESSNDGVLLTARKEQVGDALHTRHYTAPHRCHEDPSAGTVPVGYHPITIAGILCYSNQQPPARTSLYSDGNLQTVEIAGSEYQAAGAVVTKGPLCILTRVAGPRHSYMAVTKCAHYRPTHECSDTDIRHKVCDQVPHRRVTAEWIASHRLETEARSAQEREQIWRNGEVDLLVKIAMRLPVPYYDPPGCRRYCDMRWAHPHSGAKMDPPAEACALSMVRTGYP